MAVAASSGGAQWIAYWYEFHRTYDADSVETRTLNTFAFGWPLDSRSSSEKSWGDLIAETAPIIQQDIDTYGLPDG